MEGGSSSLKCGVCGADDAGRHYGGISCLRCKSFMRRAIKLDIRYVCRSTNTPNECAIRSFDRRACRSCRLRKCLAIGMDPKMVHADRIGDADAAVVFKRKREKPLEMAADSSSTDAHSLQVASFSSFVKRSRHLVPNFYGPLGRSATIALPNPRDMRELVAYIRKFDSFVSAYSEHEHWSFAEDTSSFSLELSTEEAFHFEPRRLSRRNKLSWSPHHFFSAQDSDSGWCRGILFYVDWVSHGPELQELEPLDQIRLIVGRCLPMSDCLMIAKTMQHCGGKKCLLAPMNAYVPLDAEEMAFCEQNDVIRCFQAMGAYAWSEFIEPAQEMEITEDELALLKMLVLFEPVPKLSPDGHKKVVDARLRYQTALIELLRSTMSEREALSRMGVLLSFLPVFEKVAEIEDNWMLRATFGNTGNMGGRICNEFYVQRRFR